MSLDRLEWHHDKKCTGVNEHKRESQQSLHYNTMCRRKICRNVRTRTVRTCIAPVIHDFGREVAAIYNGMYVEESRVQHDRIEYSMRNEDEVDE